MSIAGLFASGLLASQRLQPAQSQLQKFQQSFKQLGNDLAAGNLSAAQSDFAALQTSNPQLTTSANAQTGSNGVGATFNQLANDLQSGNVTGAQQDYSSIQNSLAQQSSNTLTGHRHLGLAQELQDLTNSSTPTGQAFSQLGQALQAGNLQNAQKAYTSLQQDFLALQSASAITGSGSSVKPVSTSVNVSA
jgi:hypothetical protein